jgi:NADH dehydrogenase
MALEASGSGTNGGAQRAGRRRVVIVGGGGFGGLTVARELRGADVELTVVDRVHHHLFQPLLYQVACGGLSAGEIAPPIRTTLRRSANTTVLMAQAVGLDAAGRRLELEGGEWLEYDSLVVACGAQTSYFGNDTWRDATCGLKTLVDAVELRNRIYSAFERAERTDDEDERRELMTFVVIGGGPTGVEIAGELAIVTKYSRKAARQLASIGVTVRERTRVTAIDERGVSVEVGGSTERIDARTVIWAAGVQAVPFAAMLAQETGASTDRAGRVQIEPDLTVPGHREISMIGDATSLTAPDGKPLPGLATVAIQQGRHVAKAIHAGAPSASTPFRYFDKGALAVVGRGRAVCAIRGLELSGRPAFFTYLTVHMYYLGGVPGQRLKVLIDWVTTRLGKLQNQVIEGELQTTLTHRE